MNQRIHRTNSTEEEESERARVEEDMRDIKTVKDT